MAMHCDEIAEVNNAASAIRSMFLFIGGFIN
jgi:hypothetical protein